MPFGWPPSSASPSASSSPWSALLGTLTLTLTPPPLPGLLARTLSHLRDTRPLQRRLVRYLLHRVLGGLLVIPDDGTLERSTSHLSLDADLASRQVTLKDVQLNVEAVNVLLCNHSDDLPFELHLLGGRVGAVRVRLGSLSSSSSPATPAAPPPRPTPPSGPAATSPTDEGCDAHDASAPRDAPSSSSSPSQSAPAPAPASGSGSASARTPPPTTTTTADLLFNAPIRFEADGVELDIKLSPRPLRRKNDKEERPPSQDEGEGEGAGAGAEEGHVGAAPESDGNHRDSAQLPEDLAASIYSIAEGFVQEAPPDLTGTRETTEAGHAGDGDGDDDDDDDPFLLPGAFAAPSANAQGSQSPSPGISKDQVGLVATIIERLLARLEVSVREIVITLHIVSPSIGNRSDETTEEPVKLQLRVDTVASKTELRDLPSRRGTGTSSVRTLTSDGISVWMREPVHRQPHVSPTPASSAPTAPSPQEAPTQPSPLPSSPSSTTSRRSTRTDSSADMAMSVAIADLRTSQADQPPTPPSPSASTTESMYFSTADPAATVSSRFQPPSPSRSPSCSQGRVPAASSDLFSEERLASQKPPPAQPERRQTPPMVSPAIHTDGPPPAQADFEPSGPHTPPPAAAGVTEWKQILGVLGSPKLAEAGASVVVRVSENVTAGETTDSSAERSTIPVSTEARLDILVPALRLLLQPTQLACLVDLASILSLGSSNERRHHETSATAADTPPRSDPANNSLFYCKAAAVEILLPLTDCGTNLMDFDQDRVASDTLVLSLTGGEAAYRTSSQGGKIAVRRFHIALLQPPSPGATERSTVRPILLPDPGLAWLYDHTALKTQETLPSSDEDWTRLRRTRIQHWTHPVPPATPPSRSVSVPVLNDAVAVRVSREGLQVILQPLALFLDLPLLDSLRSVRPQDTPASPPEDTVPVQARHSQSSSDRIKPRHCLSVDAACIRVHLRAPCPATGQLRAGLLTLDIWNPHLATSASITKPGPPSPPAAKSRNVQFGGNDPHRSQDLATLAFDTVAVFLQETMQIQKRTCIAVVGNAMKPRQVVRYIRETQDDRSVLRLRIKCQLTGIKTALTKSCLDALQYLADDLAQSFAAPGQQDTCVDADEELGSTTTASRHKQTASRETNRSSILETSSSSRSHTVASADVSIESIDVILLVPIEGSDRVRDIRLSARGAHAAAELRQNGKDDLVVNAKIFSCTLVERVEDRTITRLRRLNNNNDTTTFTSPAAAATPVLEVALVASIDPESLTKHSRIRVKVSRMIYDLSLDTAWMEDLGRFLKAPPGAFLNVVPTETTKFDIAFHDAILRLLPQHFPSALALELANLTYSAKLRHKQQRFPSRLEGKGLSLWINDEAVTGREGEVSMKSLGYVPLARIDRIESPIHQSTSAGRPSLSATVKDVRLHLTACPDTIITLNALISDLQPPLAGDSELRSAPPPLSIAQSRGSDLSGSIILPISARSNEKEGNPQCGPQPNSSSSSVTMTEEGATLTVFGQGPLSIDRDYQVAATAPALDQHQRTPLFDIRLEDTSLTISLFEGYDFENTRKYIRDTVKRTRRKLEKIKQLLAEGQTPEETIDDAVDYLMQSVFLPPPRTSSRPSSTKEPASGGQDLSRSRMEIIEAFDDELDQIDDLAVQASWEELPDRPPGSRRHSSSNSVKPALEVAKGHELLRRPKSSAIDVKLVGASVHYRKYPEDDTVPEGVASDLTLNVATFEIIDNLRSSTWHKFLTELRPRDGGLVRPTGSPMVKVGLKMVRSGKDTRDEEALLTVRVAPLRLHVDQDALDFLKAFFSFRMDDDPVQASIPAPKQTSSSEEGTNPTATSQARSSGFIQRVEIFAIKVKLDYKPKRVDYHALRKGRTIEMMNFFSFEESEMVLRHLVINAVPSWAILGDRVQEIWTPDVKANQLSDFITGINNSAVPLRSLSNLSSGALNNLILLPMHQYRKDGRLARGITKGTTRFAKSTALEGIKLGAKLATGTQVILENAETLLTGRTPSAGAGPGLASTSAGHTHRFGELTVADGGLSEDEQAHPQSGEVSGDLRDAMSSELGTNADHLSRFSVQPKDYREGAQMAYKALSGNVKSAAETILAVPMEMYERSDEGPVRAVIRAVPIAVLRPMIGVTEAVSKTLLGVRNSIDPSAREEVQDKYKKPSI